MCGCGAQGRDSSCRRKANTLWARYNWFGLWRFVGFWHVSNYPTKCCYSLFSLCLTGIQTALKREERRSVFVCGTYWSLRERTRPSRSFSSPRTSLSKILSSFSWEILQEKWALCDLPLRLLWREEVVASLNVLRKDLHMKITKMLLRTWCVTRRCTLFICLERDGSVFFCLSPFHIEKKTELYISVYRQTDR